MSMKRKIIFIFIIIIVGILSFLVTYKVANEDKIVIKKNEIAVPQEFVLNPSLQILSANVEGTLAEKADDYFILEADGHRVKIFIEPRGLTSFLLSSDMTKYIDYDELKVGDTLKGGVSIVVSEESTIGMTGERKRGDIIAHNFVVKNR